MICPIIQTGNRKEGLKVAVYVNSASSPDQKVKVTNGGWQKAGVTTLFSGGIYDLSTDIAALQTAEYAMAIIAINPLANRTVYAVGSPSSSVAAGTLTVLSYNPNTAEVTFEPNLDANQQLVGLYVKDENGTIYEITANNLATDSPMSPSSDTLTIADGPTDVQATDDPFFAGKNITIVGQGLDSKVGGHKENVHKLTVASTSPGGYYPDLEIDLTTTNAQRSTIAVDEALIDDELGIDLTTTLYVHYQGGVWEVTDVSYASPNVLIEVKAGPYSMPDGATFWVAPYKVAPTYAVTVPAPVTIPCVPDTWIPLATVLIYDGMGDLENVYDLREDFNLLSNEASAEITPQDITITGDTTNVVLGQIYIANAAPIVTNDSLDSAGSGTKFQNGALWLDKTNAKLYILTDSTPNAAVWTVLN